MRFCWAFKISPRPNIWKCRLLWFRHKRAYHAWSREHVRSQHIRHVWIFKVTEFSIVSIKEVHGRRVPEGFGWIQEPQGIAVTVKSIGGLPSCSFPFSRCVEEPSRSTTSSVTLRVVNKDTASVCQVSRLCDAWTGSGSEKEWEYKLVECFLHRLWVFCIMVACIRK